MLTGLAGCQMRKTSHLGARGWCWEAPEVHGAEVDAQPVIQWRPHLSGNRDPPGGGGRGDGVGSPGPLRPRCPLSPWAVPDTSQSALLPAPWSQPLPHHIPKVGKSDCRRLSRWLRCQSPHLRLMPTYLGFCSLWALMAVHLAPRRPPDLSVHFSQLPP